MAERAQTLRVATLDPQRAGREFLDGPMDGVGAVVRTRGVVGADGWKNPIGSSRGGGVADEDDDQLLARAGGGDAAAFRQLVNRHLGLVVAVARRVLNDEAEAEDVAQDVMLRLWNTGGTLEVQGAGLRPWLRRVTSNLCIDRIRGRRRTVVTDEVPEQLQEPTQTQQLDERDLGKRVGEVMARLPERQRIALSLFHLEGLSQQEVAKALAVSEDAVESLLARARRAVKAALESEWRDLLPDPNL